MAGFELALEDEGGEGELRHPKQITRPDEPLLDYVTVFSRSNRRKRYQSSKV